MFTEKLLLDAYPKMRRFAMKLTRKSDAADDLTQMTALKILEKSHLYVDGNFSGWACKIMFNIFLTDKNRAKRHGHHEHDEYILDNIPTEERQFNIIYAKELSQALCALSPQHRSCINLVASGLGYGDIARLEGIPVGTVRSRLSRGREMLRLSTEAA